MGLAGGLIDVRHSRYVTPGRRVPRVDLARMVAAMTHRGPDASHFWYAEDVAVGMRRLAIVDVAGGAQPLSNESGSVQVVFNGEIYNHKQLRGELAARGHRFISRSDGEVIPHLYEELGSRLFARLEGIFAVALWDSEEKEMLLAPPARGQAVIRASTRLRPAIRFRDQGAARGSCRTPGSRHGRP